MRNKKISRKAVKKQRNDIQEFSIIEDELRGVDTMESDMILLSEGFQEKRNFNEEKLLSDSSESINEIFNGHKVEKRLFWLFIEFFLLRTKMPLKEFMGSLEKTIILKTLHNVSGNQKEAAEILGIKHTTLNEKIKRYNIRFRKK